jgi:acyl-CoA reductase-like NAD-dependent aldehyde dehydrogenase
LSSGSICSKINFFIPSLAVASPIGVIAAIIPSTNPTSTTIYKALIALKGRNVVVFSPHPSAVRCITETARLLADAAEAAAGGVRSASTLTAAMHDQPQSLGKEAA